MNSARGENWFDRRREQILSRTGFLAKALHDKCAAKTSVVKKSSSCGTAVVCTESMWAVPVLLLLMVQCLMQSHFLLDTFSTLFVFLCDGKFFKRCQKPITDSLTRPVKASSYETTLFTHAFLYTAFCVDLSPVAPERAQ